MPAPVFVTWGASATTAPELCSSALLACSALLILQADAAFQKAGAGWDLPTQTPRSTEWGAALHQHHKSPLQPRTSTVLMHSNTLGHQGSGNGNSSPTRVNIIAPRDPGSEAAQGGWQPSPHSHHQRGILRASMAGNEGVQHQGSLRQRQHRSHAGGGEVVPSPFADKAAAQAISGGTPRRPDYPAGQGQHQQHEGNEAPGAPGMSAAKGVTLPSLKGVVKHVMQQQQQGTGSMDKAVQKLKSTANAVSVMSDVTRLMQSAVRQVWRYRGREEGREGGRELQDEENSKGELMVQRG